MSKRKYLLSLPEILGIFWIKIQGAEWAQVGFSTNYFNVIPCQPLYIDEEDENLNKEATYSFVNNAFRDGYVQTFGKDLAGILPPISRFSASGNRTQKRLNVVEKITAFFNRFKDLIHKKL